jgi:hypothetical protein
MAVPFPPPCERVEAFVAKVAVAAFPVTLIPHEPLAPVPVSVGA